jgi:hypothetical protein
VSKGQVFLLMAFGLSNFKALFASNGLERAETK